MSGTAGGNGPTWINDAASGDGGHERDAVRRTAARAVEAVATIVQGERTRRHSAGLVRVWDLSREDLDEAASSLGVPPMSDEEWDAIRQVSTAKGF
jgi:hypothetical protein